MRRVLTSFGFGDHAAMLGIALPTFRRYAETHGYDLFIPHENFFADVVYRPSSWRKIPLFRRLFGQGYDEILWIDADVVVRRFDRDIADDCTGEPIHMVVHETGDGSVPNCGVWFVRSSFTPYLETVWGLDGSRRSGVWWEQAAVISLLGGDPDAEKVLVPAGPLWGELPYEWNPHARDARGIPSSVRFFHATTLHDRAAHMRRAVGDPT